MTAIFIHGVPDTEHVWHRVLANLTRQDARAVSLPGFGCPVPAGFSATKEAYVDWLIADIEREGRPVDIAGHDWGAFLTLRLVQLRPDLVRSWVYGSAPLDPDYTWHSSARAWQTRGLGELAMALTPTALLRREMHQGGVPAEDAAHAASKLDRTMKDSILKLYRSAIHIGTEWSQALEAIDVPGLILWGQDDPYAPVAIGERLAARTGARLVTYPDCGHWWPAQHPEAVTADIESFWASLEA